MTFVLAVLSPVARGQERTSAKAEMKTYRLNYTITETDAGKKVGVQHYAQTETPGNLSSTVKLGSKVPVPVAGSGDSPEHYQITYIDIGLNISTSLFEQDNGLQVRTVVEQSSVADSPGGRPDRPIIRQARLESTAVLPPPGKSVILGSVDIPGSTRHLEVELTVERVP